MGYNVIFKINFEIFHKFYFVSNTFMCNHRIRALRFLINRLGTLIYCALYCCLLSLVYEKHLVQASRNTFR